MRATWEIGPDVEAAPHAGIQEFGGTIRPRSAQVLHFFTGDGEEVFARQVEIPGQPYIRPAFDNGLAEAVLAVGATFEKLVITPVAGAV